MTTTINIIKVSQIIEDSIDYNSIIFKVYIEKQANIESFKEISVLLNTLINGGAIKIIVNMKELTKIDSAGIGTFINYTKLLRKKNGDLVFSSIPEEINKIFSIVNLHSFIKIFKNDVEAENHFRYV